MHLVGLGDPLLDLDVVGRPATYSTAAQVPWQAAIRKRLLEAGVEAAPAGRLHITIEFRLDELGRTGMLWDIDNLVKPTMDAMEGVLGLRVWRGKPQAQDDRVDSLYATKRFVHEGETSGARICVFLLPSTAG